MDISLVNIDVRDLSFENKVQGTQKLEMETNVQYSVNIAANIPQCRGEAWLTVQEKSSAHLVALKLHVVGVFNYTPTPVTDEVKRELHDVLANLGPDDVDAVLFTDVQVADALAVPLFRHGEFKNAVIPGELDIVHVQLRPQQISYGPPRQPRGDLQYQNAHGQGLRWSRSGSPGWLGVSKKNFGASPPAVFFLAVNTCFTSALDFFDAFSRAFFSASVAVSSRVGTALSGASFRVKTCVSRPPRR